MKNVINFPATKTPSRAETGIKVLKKWPSGIGERYQLDIRNCISEIEGMLELGDFKGAATKVWSVVNRLNEDCAVEFADSALRKFSQLSKVCPNNKTLQKIEKAISEMKAALLIGNSTEVCKKARWIFSRCSEFLREEYESHSVERAEREKAKRDKATRKAIKVKRNRANRAVRGARDRQHAKGG